MEGTQLKLEGTSMELIALSEADEASSVQGFQRLALKPRWLVNVASGGSLDHLRR